MKNPPTLQTAIDIAQRLLKRDVLSCQRLTTGNQNFVYCVDDYIVRITDKKHESYFEAGQFWQTILIPLGIPVEPFLYLDKGEEFCSVLMRKVPGTDLQHVYSQLSLGEKENIARKIFEMQEKVALLPHAKGYGYGRSFDCEELFPTWKDYLSSHFDNFKERILDNKKVDISVLDPALEIFESIDFSGVVPRAYLRDISERNVMIKDAQISGIIDVDDMGFGDPLMVVALTEIALLKEGLDNHYPRYWKSLMKLDSGGEERYQFYLIFYLLTFIKACGSNTYNNQKMEFDLEVLMHELKQLYLSFSLVGIIKI